MRFFRGAFRGRRVLLAVEVGLLWALVCAPVALATGVTGNDVGANLGGLLRHYAVSVYGGIVAIVSLVFLVNRRYTELSLFLLAAVLVAWMVFVPEQIGKVAAEIAKQVL